jgi:molybdopterin synthase catalytic subunit
LITEGVLERVQALSFFRMIKVSEAPISPEQVVNHVKTLGSGCVVTYIGLIRDKSRGKLVASVEYQDADGQASARLEGIAAEIKRRWPVNKVTIHHRIGKLKVSDINFVVAISAAHRREAFAAVRFAVDSFKKKLPTIKRETYTDGTARP